MMGYSWHDVVGNLGVVLIVATYLLLQLGRLSSRQLSYSLLNALGAALVVVSLLFEFNLSAFIVELFWLVISLLGIVVYLRHRNR
jgi:hypothetical protein